MQTDILTIVGPGLIGASLGLAAKQRRLARVVRGIGRQQGSLDRARALGAIDEAYLDPEPALAGAGLVIFCTPVDRIAAQVLDYARHCAPGTLLTDAGSTKGSIVAAIEGKLPAGIAFVGSHPLAGSEKRGPEFAVANLFEERWTVVTRTPRTDPAALEKISAFWRAAGSRVTVMSPEDHDRALALTSHLPHLAAASLAGILPEEIYHLAATGFRDTTRIAAGDPGLWTAIFTHNQPSLLAALGLLNDRLRQFRTALEKGDAAALEALLTQAKKVRDALEIEIVPKYHDPEAERVCQEVALFTHSSPANHSALVAARGYLVEGIFPSETAERLMGELLLDPIVELGRVGELNAFTSFDNPASHPAGAGRFQCIATVLPKPGVMDPVAESVELAARDLGIDLFSVRTFRRYYAGQLPEDGARELLVRKVLANDAIEQVVEGPLQLNHLTLGSDYAFKRITLPLRSLDDDGLTRLSREGQLSLSLAEMKAIQAHFQSLGRDPTDIELETFAQTWSEHCSHKTLKGQIDFQGRRIANLLKETIFGATQEIRRRLGADDWCVSVFEDNAGVIRFDDNFHVCFKVETHNHPSALEPYGGANTGLGGVIRDPLGTGLGAKPICNTDVFCFAPPDTPPESLPPGVLHPRKVMKGVVAGVRDYGNRMGIPTVNGAVCFDSRYLGNPLVFCGTVGLIPVNRSHKEARPGDFIVAVGGRTGRDGIHGATFSSIELTSASEKVSGGAVQIGNAITEKKLLDVILEARERGLYHAITDCGAGGFSSAIGEMGEHLGAVVHLDQAPLKYQGLSYTEIWISEAQERMVLAVPPKNWDILRMLCQSEDVEATVLGTFQSTGKLSLFFQSNQVADLDMHFLHNGRPAVVRQATWKTTPAPTAAVTTTASRDYNDILKKILSSLNVCSKEWIIRQYDHEVQGGSVIKPLVGAANDGPGDAAVVMPVLGSWRGLAIGCGLNPNYGDLDPYQMAALAIDEAARNVVAVGADPSRIALLDNFCWGNTERPEVLGSLVRAAEACRDVALAYTMPFVSGKDSLNNEFHAQGRNIVIPPTLLISAMGIVPDLRQCVTMDLKEAGNVLVLIGATTKELGGSHYYLVTGQPGGSLPSLNMGEGRRVFQKIHEAMKAGLVRSCHDVSEGGLAATLAEMSFAGNIGADITRLTEDNLPDEAALFNEAPTRFVLEVRPDKLEKLTELCFDLAFVRLGKTCREPRLRIAGGSGEWLVWAPIDQLKEAWQKPLRW